MTRLAVDHRRAEIAQLSPLLFKPSLDDRYGEADVARLAVMHHERLDGSGYPRNLILGHHEVATFDPVAVEGSIYESANPAESYLTPILLVVGLLVSLPLGRAQDLEADDALAAPALAEAARSWLADLPNEVAQKIAYRTGQVTNAVYGFTSMLLNLLREHDPDRIGEAIEMTEVKPTEPVVVTIGTIHGEIVVANCFAFLFIASKGGGILSVDAWLERRQAELESQRSTTQ